VFEPFIFTPRGQPLAASIRQVAPEASEHWEGARGKKVPMPTNESAQTLSLFNKQKCLIAPRFQPFLPSSLFFLQRNPRV
jgi:hypothetical protein